MNECIFFFHLATVLSSLWFSIKKGKSALYLFVTLQALFANLFVVKQIHLFGMDVTCSDVYAIGALVGLNFLREIYGEKEAKRALLLTFFSLLFFVIMGELHLLYIPNHFDGTHKAFTTIFSSTPRIIFASLGVFYLVQRIDLFFYRILRKRGGIFIRMNGALLLSQFLDTLLFTVLGLSGVVSSLWDVLIVSFLIKAVIILFNTMSMPFFIPLIKRVEE